VGLDLKQLRGRLLALIVGGVIVLAAVVAGVIVIAAGGSGGGSTSSSGIDTSFKQPRSFESIDAVYKQESFTCDSKDSPCIEKFVRKVTDDYGPKASLGILQRLYQEHRVDLSVNDHQMAHVVGRETSKDYGSNFKAFDLCPTSFNYGCDHGFFEWVLARTANPKQAATTICESLNPATNLLIAGFTCYHGVGHGIMMAEAYNVPASLKACNTMPTAQAQDGCWQGVFMENVNAGMQGRALPGVFKRSDPLAPCDKVADKYKHECYINHSGWLMVVSHDNTAKASRYCLKAAGEPRTACLQSIGLMVTNPVWQSTLAPELAHKSQGQIAANLCARFPAAGRRDCVIAGVDNIANFDQLSVTRERAFCAAVSSELKDTCYKQIGVDLRNRTADQQVIKRSCSGLGAKQNLCIAGARR
jgi:hypothetical protein